MRFPQKRVYRDNGFTLTVVIDLCVCQEQEFANGTIPEVYQPTKLLSSDIKCVQALRGQSTICRRIIQTPQHLRARHGIPTVLSPFPKPYYAFFVTSPIVKWRRGHISISKIRSMAPQETTHFLNSNDASSNRVVTALVRLGWISN